MSNRLFRLSTRLYRLALYVYSREHRDAYWQPMCQTFNDMCRAAYARRGLRGVALEWLAAVPDLAISAARDQFATFRRRNQMSRRSLITLCAVLVFALLTGYVNLNASEVQAPMGCLLLFSAVAGFLQPKAAWRWGVVIGLSIPLSYFIGFAINCKVVDPPHLPITLVVLVIPALVAAYLGALASRVITPQPPRAT